MIAADADSISKQYEILLHECREYNPDLLDKHRMLAITKCDLIDKELEELITAELPKDIPTIFISAVTGQNIQQLKDMLWRSIDGLK
jgi:GTP-binding protein